MNSQVLYVAMITKKRMLSVLLFCLIGLLISTTTKSQTIAFNGASNSSIVSNNPSDPGNDGKKKTKHSKSNPTVTITKSGIDTNYVICVGTAYQITYSSAVTGGVSPYTYTWSSFHGTILGGANNPNATFFWNNPTLDTIKLKVVDSNNPVDSTVTWIYVNIRYCADFLPSRQDICLDSCVYFYDFSSGTPTHWQWTFGNSNADATVNNTTSNVYTSSADSTNDSIFCVHFHTPGWQTVTLSITNANGLDTSKTYPQDVFVGACPHASYSSSIPLNDTICNCKCIQFTKNSLTDPFSQTQKWYFINVATLIMDTTDEPNPLICFNVPGDYLIIMVDSNSVGRDSLYGDTLHVVQCTKPSANIAISIVKDSTCDCYAICTGECVKFTDASCNTPTNWHWEFPGGSPNFMDSTAGPIEVCYYNFGQQNLTYHIKMVDTNAFGFDSAYATLIVKPNPVINLSSHPDAIVNGTITLITGTSVTITESGNDPFAYYWSYTPETYTHPDSLSPDTAQYPNYVFVDPTISHWYYVHTVGSNGCVQNDSLYIKVVKNSDIYVPNAFSPNGDGKDDYLYVRSNFIRTLYFAVYDRWGAKVFETTDINAGWDGTYRGQPENNGVFDWYVKATLFNGKEVLQKGNTTLIR